MSNGDQGPAAWMESAIRPWVEDPNRDHAQLMRWLSGSDLPPVGHDEEPYVWLLRAIPRGAERPRFEARLAECAGQLLEEAGQFRLTSEGEKILYNLLALCAGLRGRDHLAAPLLRVLHEDQLDSVYYGVHPLNSLLRPALIYNQRDNTLQPVWESLLRGTPHKILGGNAPDGFQGILYMPPSEAERGSPAVEAIGEALTRIVAYFETRPNKVKLLREFIDRVQTRYPGHGWELEIIGFSDRYGWPRWTDVALPSLNIRSGENQFVTWLHVVNLLQKPFQVETLRQWAEGRICEIRLPQERHAFYLTVCKSVEKYRRKTSDGGENAERGIVSAYSEELRLHFKKYASHEGQNAAEGVQRDNARVMGAGYSG